MKSARSTATLAAIARSLESGRGLKHLGGVSYAAGEDIARSLESGRGLKLKDQVRTLTLARIARSLESGRGLKRSRAIAWSKSRRSPALSRAGAD